MHIKGFTPAIQQIYNIHPTDIGRKLSDFTSTAGSLPSYPDPNLVTDDAPDEAEFLANGRYYLRRILPYRTAEGRRDGLVVAFLDVTELRVSEGRLRQLADSVPVITWLSDSAGNVELFNQRWYEYTGQTMDRALGWGWQNAIHPEDLAAANQAWQESIASGKEYRVDYRLRSSNGSYRWFSAHGIPFKTDVGRITNWCGTLNDIQETKDQLDLLTRSGQYFQRLVDHSPAMIWITNKAAECTYLSKQWYVTTGRTPEQDLGFGWVENCHPEDREAAAKAFFTAIESRGRISVRYRLRHADGSYRWAIDSGLPLLSDDGEFLGYIGTVVDIHDQVASEKQLSDLNERFRKSADAVDLGVWYCDLPFDELIWNKEVKNHFHMAPDARVTIKDFYDHIHPDDRETTRAAIQYSNDHRAPYDIVYRTIDPKDPRQLKWIRAIGWTDYDAQGNPIRFDGITLDTTAEHLRQLEIKNARDAAETARKVAEAANESKSRFLANMSHEIRTPISAIVGFSDLLRTRLGADEEVNTYIERISRNSSQLSRLIDELLDLSKIEANRLEVESATIDAEAVIEDARSAMMLRAQKKGLELNFKWRTPKPTRLVTDPVRLSQILINIIGNAVKFTESGRVDVEFACENGRLSARVTDTGLA